MKRRDAGRPAILHYCQHSVGLGHLVRSLSVAGALARDFRVVLMSGGKVPAGIDAPDGVELVPLPAIGSGDGVGARLVSLVPGMDLEKAWERRREMLLRQLEQLRPVAVVIELFPLGRRMFAAELIPLLEAARALASPPVIVCSVRDILVANGPEQQRRDDQAARRLNRYFDMVVVHADPHFVRLEDTFRPSIPVTPPVQYSGFVVPPGERSPGRQRQPPEILVSAGGGRVGGRLLRTAAQAQLRHLGKLGITTRVVTGPFLPAEDAAALSTLAADCPGLSVESFVPDLRTVMAGSSVSVSQCGYNTALDVLRSGVPALVVPHDDGRETEQAERARRLAALGAVRVLPTRDLSAARLADEIVPLLGTKPKATTFDQRGAERTAAIVSGLIAEPRLSASIEAAS